ncbi:MAG: glycosyltransferase family 2 protein [Proteobacteria bacterium]|nr:glycosyltransferase family 2 protein [Pseudomonadota bacterium]
MPRHKFSLVACARWEEAYIQEWIEYHQSIGFDHIYLYSNDDDPAPLISAVSPYLHGDKPFVTLRHWRHIGEQPQIYLHFLETFREETEWFSFLDIDEFFTLKGVDDIYAFMLDYQSSTDCLYFNWVQYGHSFKQQRDDLPVLTSYLWRAAGPADATKLLCRASSVPAELVRDGLARGRGAFWHFLDNYNLPDVRCRDVLYHPTQGYSANLPDSPRPFVTRPGFAGAILDRAYIAHVQFKSEEDFLRRWRRGGFDNGEHWKALFESGRYKTLLAEANQVYDTYLAAYWHRYTEAARRVDTQPHLVPPPGENVALNKPSWQSSVHRPGPDEPPGSRILGGGNNGLRRCAYGFHTQAEPRPWWVVDLLAPHVITEIHIYNRRDTHAAAARSRTLELRGSADGATWETLYRHQGEPFGFDGMPLVARLPPGTQYRFIQVRLHSDEALHLVEVEVYGMPSPRPVALVGTALSPEALSADG